MWPARKAISIAIFVSGAYCVWGLSGDIALVIGLGLMVVAALMMIKSFETPTEGG